MRQMGSRSKQEAEVSHQGGDFDKATTPIKTPMPVNSPDRSPRLSKLPSSIQNSRE